MLLFDNISWFEFGRAKCNHIRFVTIFFSKYIEVNKLHQNLDETISILLNLSIYWLTIKLNNEQIPNFSRCCQ